MVLDPSKSAERERKETDAFFAEGRISRKVTYFVRARFLTLIGTCVLDCPQNTGLPPGRPGTGANAATPTNAKGGRGDSNGYDGRGQGWRSENKERLPRREQVSHGEDIDRRWKEKRRSRSRSGEPAVEHERGEKRQRVD